MAFIFLVFLIAMGAIYWNQRKLAIGLTAAGIILMLGMFWHHVTDVLKINW